MTARRNTVPSASRRARRRSRSERKHAKQSLWWRSARTTPRCWKSAFRCQQRSHNFLISLERCIRGT